MCSFTGVDAGWTLIDRLKFVAQQRLVPPSIGRPQCPRHISSRAATSAGLVHRCLGSRAVSTLVHRKSCTVSCLRSTQRASVCWVICLVYIYGLDTMLEKGICWLWVATECVLLLSAVAAPNDLFPVVVHLIYCCFAWCSISSALFQCGLLLWGLLRPFPWLLVDLLCNLYWRKVWPSLLFVVLYGLFCEGMLWVLCLLP